MIDRRGDAEAPAVSAILAIPDAWSGSLRGLAASLESLLSQTLRDIEVIVADPGAHTEVAALLSAYDDPRLRLAVGEEVELRGRYVAVLAACDISLPTRLSLQSGYLNTHPDIAVVSAGTRLLAQGIPVHADDPVDAPDAVQCWLFSLGLSPPVSSLMVRQEAAESAEPLLSAAREPAALLDLCLRSAGQGQFAWLGKSLVLLGDGAEPVGPGMEAGVVAKLVPHYEPLFAERAKTCARLVARHIAATAPVPDAPGLARLLDIFDVLNRDFCVRHKGDAAALGSMRPLAGKIWRQVLGRAAAAGTVQRRFLLARLPQDIDFTAAGNRRVAQPESAASLVATPPAQFTFPPVSFYGVPYAPCPSEPADAPSLFVVVDTEAEFDWAKPFARELTSVSAMDDIERGQAVFDTYGLRPIYVVDYPIATQERGFSKLRAIMERDGCEIGAHLHPWTTPPFEEALSERNSYPGNLDADLERRKLVSLIEAIQANFGVTPVFYKAGRYGFGPNTARLLAEHGIAVDLSVLPGADLRRQGGPDFRALKPVLYRIGSADALTLPMTRSEVGLLPALAGVGNAIHAVPGGGLLRLPSVLSRLRIAETITLTPEGVTADEQVRLIRTMLKRGCRRFVLHYHSPSLSPGNTPYAKDRTGAETLLLRLQTVCRFFFETLGGVPGYPKDLLRLRYLP